ncbi:MAG: tryptophan 7-halogenase [Planctomycetales bacterium]|nr:tryptophan 7-halogenase [Planctomycetales bacterium]
MSALTLKSMLPELRVTLVHDSNLPPIGVGESTTALLPRFLHDGLGLDRRQFQAAVRPSWKLGLRFDWGLPDGSHFYYPFDWPVDGRAGTLGKENAYFYFADRRVTTHYTEMMERGRAPFLMQSDGALSTDNHFGYHIENHAFIQFLHSQTAGRGIESVDSQVVKVDVDATGAISQLCMRDGSVVVGDLYVDCSGFASRLLGETLREPFLPYNKSLFCDTAVTGSWKRNQGVLPYTTCQTMNHGWCWQIDLPDRVHRGYVFSSQFCDVEEATREMKARNPLMGDDIHTVRFRAGRYARFWVKNVAAIGNAGGFVEPLEATGLHMIAVVARTLAQAIVDNDQCVTPSMQQAVNRYVGQMWDDIRDCLAIHFAFNRRIETPFWRHCRANTDLGRAAELVDFYRANGPSSMAGELIPRNSIFRWTGYLALLIGQQVESDYTFRPDESETYQWRQVCEQMRQTAQLALPMDEALMRIVGE